MRRLANQSRNDAYSSFKDYQTIHERQGLRVTPEDGGSHALLLEATLISDLANTTYVGFGGFFYPSADIMLTIEIEAATICTSLEVPLGKVWNRTGIIIDAPNAEDVKVKLIWQGPVSINLWGLTAGAVNLPDTVLATNPSVQDLQQSHLAPESFYFLHDEALALEFNEEKSSKLHLVSGELIYVKKCAYCGRFLPLDPKRPNALSFGKHNAKKSGHQNECRVCKKWHINNTFNPNRTSDQLHESSVITRERSLFLQEPEVLQRIKDRTGAGLKSLSMLI